MPARVTNEELRRRCQVATREANHLAAMMDNMASLEMVTTLRNQLRAAYCAAQELKNRMKTEQKITERTEKP